MTVRRDIPAAWRNLLLPNMPDSLPEKIDAFLAAESDAGYKIFPGEERRFAALQMTPPEEIRAVILGQDPYHDDGQAHGLAFSVPPGIRIPPSLKNIYRELADDLQIDNTPVSGCLSSWAEQGVLLLNTALSVRAHQPMSHHNKGWEVFTDAVIRTAAMMPQPKVFILWGKPAQEKEYLITKENNLVLKAAHPSPLSAYRGFFGSRPFSQCNRFLQQHGVKPVEWSTVFNNVTQGTLEL